MKFSVVFNLTIDADDLLDFFKKDDEIISTPEQLVSRLELLKRKHTEDLLACIHGLAASVAAIKADTLETSGTIGDLDGEEEEGEEDGDLDKELADIENEADLESPTVESEKPAASMDVEKAKNSG